MIVYNDTVKAEPAIAAAWLQWLIGEHAPEMLATGCFHAFHVLHLPELDNAEGITYAVQYHAHTMADYERYRSRFAATFQQKAAARWGTAVVSFSTLMQTIV